MSAKDYISLVNIIRNNFLNVVSKEKNNYHEIDVYRVCSDDWTIKRFLSKRIQHKNEVDAMLKAYRWKNEFGVYRIKTDDFIRELHERNDPELFGQDKRGKHIIWIGIRNRNEPLIKEMIPLYKQWFVYLYEKHDKIVHDKGSVSINWLFGIDNFIVRKALSMETWKFLCTLNDYYPLMVRYTLIVDMPRIYAIMARGSFSILNQLFKEVKWEVKYISRDQLLEFVDWQLIPIEMGGPRIVNIVIPENIKPLNQHSTFKLSEKSLKLFKKHHESVKKNINNLIDLRKN